MRELLLHPKKADIYMVLIGIVCVIVYWKMTGINTHSWFMRNSELIEVNGKQVRRFKPNRNTRSTGYQNWGHIIAEIAYRRTHRRV